MPKTSQPTPPLEFTRGPIYYSAHNTPAASTAALAHFGSQLTGQGAVNARYHQLYRRTYTPRDSCPEKTAKELIDCLRGLRLSCKDKQDSAHQLYSETQESRKKLHKLSPDYLSTLNLHDSNKSHQKAIRILRSVDYNRPVSRLSLTIDGSKSVEAYKVLVNATLAHGCVENCKIMSPDLIGNGPDDLVIYLNKTLGTSKVAELVDYIQSEDKHEKKGKFLVEGGTPLGKERLATGIYGADLPVPQGIAGKPEYKFNGSHGMDRAKIVTYAREKHAEQEANGQHKDFQEVLNEVLKSVGLDPENPARRSLNSSGSTSSTATRPVATSRGESSQTSSKKRPFAEVENDAEVGDDGEVGDESESD
jgi:hypothetical protein